MPKLFNISVLVKDLTIRNIASIDVAIRDLYNYISKNLKKNILPFSINIYMSFIILICISIFLISVSFSSAIPINNLMDSTLDSIQGFSNNSDGILYTSSTHYYVDDVIEIALFKENGLSSIDLSDSTHFDEQDWSLEVFMEQDYSYSYKYLGLTQNSSISFIPSTHGVYIIVLTNSLSRTYPKKIYVLPKEEVTPLAGFVNNSSINDAGNILNYGNLLSNSLDASIIINDGITSNNSIASSNNDVVNSGIIDYSSNNIIDNTASISVNIRDSKRNIDKNKLNTLNGLVHSYANHDFITGKTNYNVSIDLNNTYIKNAKFNKIDSVNFDIGLESPTTPIVHEYFGNFIKHVSFDPRNASFSDGLITVIAQGNELWKCKNYDFSTQMCKGDFFKVMNIIPGQEYNITVLPEDPLWSEVQTISCSCQDAQPSTPGSQSTANCSVYCAVNFSVQSDFNYGFIQQIDYNITATITTTSSGTGFHSGFLDGDNIISNNNASIIDSSNSATTVTTVLSNNLTNSSGFNKENCPTWSSGYCTWYVFLNTTATTGGNSKAITANISLNKLNYTWNYTDFSIPDINVSLNYPANTLLIMNNSVNFSFNVTSTNTLVNCSLYDNESSWSSKVTSSTIVNGTLNYINKFYNSDGNYTWNILCYDLNNNFAFASSNYTFSIRSSDLQINASDIFFDNTRLVEGSNITIYANITNLGFTNITDSIIVQFYLGDINFGGKQIDSNITLYGLNANEIKSVNVSYILATGMNNIFVYVDNANTLTEFDKFNNNANVSISIVMYQYYYGNITANLLLGTSNDTIFFNPLNLTTFRGNIFITDADSVFSFTKLQALGRDIDNNSVSDDFSDLDYNMNTSGFSDSINSIWTDNTDIPIYTNSSKITSLFTLHNVPLVNSSNDSNFETGILWDTSDDMSNNFQYDTTDKEDVIFITSFDTTTNAGKDYLYKIKVPALLRNYKGNNDKVALYYTLE